MGSTTIHILFTVSLLLTLMKGADLILRSHQQKWLQDKLETLTLRLNYINVFEWYSKNLSFVLIRLMGVLALLFASSFLNYPLSRLFSITIGSNFILFLSSLGLAFFLNFRTKQIQVDSFNYLDGKDLSEKKENYPLFKYISRSLELLKSYILMIFVLIMTCSIGIYFLDKYYLKQNLPVFIFSLIPTLPIILDFAGILITLLLILIFSGIIIVLHILMRLIESICWRIVEYNKGAFAAINIIITVCLGAVELYLKNRTT